MCGSFCGPVRTFLSPVLFCFLSILFLTCEVEALQGEGQGLTQEEGTQDRGAAGDRAARRG